jgi:hypothetical protein
LDAGLTTLLCKKNIVAKSEEVERGWSNLHQEETCLTEVSEEGYGSKRAVLPIMIR